MPPPDAGLQDRVRASVLVEVFGLPSLLAAGIDPLDRVLGEALRRALTGAPLEVDHGLGEGPEPTALAQAIAQRSAWSLAFYLGDRLWQGLPEPRRTAAWLSLCALVLRENRAISPQMGGGHVLAFDVHGGKAGTARQLGKRIYIRTILGTAVKNPSIPAKQRGLGERILQDGLDDRSFLQEAWALLQDRASSTELREQALGAAIVEVEPRFSGILQLWSARSFVPHGDITAAWKGKSKSHRVIKSLREELARVKAPLEFLSESEAQRRGIGPRQKHHGYWLVSLLARER